MKKRLKIILIVLVCGLIISFLTQYAVKEYYSFYSGMKWHEIEDFSECKNDFTNLVISFRNVFDNELKYSNLIRLTVDTYKDEYWTLHCTDTDLKMFETKYYPSEDEIQSYKKIDQAINHNPNDYAGESPNPILVDANQVVFTSVNRFRYSIIYTTITYKPKYIRTPEEEYNMYCEHLDTNWYQAAYILDLAFYTYSPCKMQGDFLLKYLYILYCKMCK